MFGQHDDQHANDHIPDQSIEGAMATDQPQGPPPPPPVPADDQHWQHPGAPLDDSHAIGQMLDPVGPSPLQPILPPDAQDTPGSDPDVAGTQIEPNHPSVADHNPGDLADIKQKALQQLTPLVGHLDQSPEEKFRTTMMMIQASDDQALVQAAYDAANQITDEKAKAQALLDIVNEINYFTQQHQQ